MIMCSNGVVFVFSNAETLHLCCDIGRVNWLGRVLKIMCSNGVFCMLAWYLVVLKLCTYAVIVEGAMENH